MWLTGRDWPVGSRSKGKEGMSFLPIYETFTSKELRAYVKDLGLQIIGYRALRALLRQSE
jgi:hypothetical protein